MSTVDDTERGPPGDAPSGALEQLVSTQRTMLDALPAHVSLLDREGRIIAVNAAWRRSAEENALALPDAAIGQSYIDVCERAEGPFAQEAPQVAAGLRAVLSRERQSFSLDYPCHGPDGFRWFRLTATSVAHGAVIMHLDTTAERLAQQALRHQQALLTTAMRVGRMGSWVFDVAEQTLWWAPETYELFGITPDELGGRVEAFLALVLEEDRALLERAYARTSTDPTQGCEIDYRIRRPDGAVRWIHERGTTEVDEQQRPTRRLGIVMDVTERQLLEMERRELLARERTARMDADTSSSHYRSLFESAPGCYLVLEPDEFKIIAASDDFLATTSTTRAQIIDRPLFECFPDDPNDALADGEKNLRASLERVKSTGVTDIMVVQRYTLRRSTEDGEVYEDRYWSPTNSPVLGSDGRTAYIIHRTQDVTDYVRRVGYRTGARPEPHAREVQLEIDLMLRGQELKLAHARELQRQASLRIAGRVAKLGGWHYAVGEKVLTWSGETAAIHDEPPGFSPPDALQAINYYVPEHRERMATAFAACIEDGSGFDLELQITTAKGRCLWVRSIGEAVRDDQGRITQVQGGFQDINHRKTLEAHVLRSQRMESVGSLAGGIAHDLNNTLAPILLTVSSLRSDARDEHLDDALGTIETSAQRAADMVRQLLSFARGADFRRDKFDLRKLLAETQKLVRDTFPKNITLALNISDEPCQVDANETQMHQVLTNLCVNARDAMPNGGTLTVTLRRFDVDDLRAAVNIDVRPGPYILLEVDDTGTGIPREIVDRIFDPFFTTKPPGSGTGLGLSTVHSIVRDHGGFVQVYSEVLRGTKLQAYLPACTSGSVAVTPVVDPSVRPRGNGELVLVVDDEDLIRTATRRTLERFGYRVLLAANGAEAIALYSKHAREVNVVLTDMNMPIMDGPATIVALRELDPTVRIIGSSGLRTNMEDLDAKVGTLHFVSKPYTTEILLAVLKKALAEPT